jgi:hypothetical protein
MPKIANGSISCTGLQGTGLGLTAFPGASYIARHPPAVPLRPEASRPRRMAGLVPAIHVFAILDA